MSTVMVIVTRDAKNGTMAMALRGFNNSAVSEVVEGNGSLRIGFIDTPYVCLFKFASL